MEHRKYLTPPGFKSDGLEECLTFHDRTKIKPLSSQSSILRIGNYVNSNRGKEESSRNFRNYRTKSIDIGNFDIPKMNFDMVNQQRHSCRNFSRDAELERDVVLGALKSCCDTRTETIQLEESIEIGSRGYPSAGGLFPIDIFMLERQDDGYHLHYLNPRSAKLFEIDCLGFERKDELQTALCSSQRELLETAKGVFIFVAVWERSIVKYGFLGYRFAMVEIGIASHHLSLALAAGGVQTLHWGGGYDDVIASLLQFDTRSESVGHLMWYGIEKNE